MTPLYSVLRVLFPKTITTTERLGRVMLRLARSGYSKHVLESSDIVRLEGGAGAIARARA
jgi:hypothetical protein